MFVRVSLDLICETARRRAALPEDWRRALKNCLARADESERNIYLAGLAKAYMRARADPAPQPADSGAQRLNPTTREDLNLATREDIAATLSEGAPDRLIALAGDRKARLRPEHVETLVARARALAESGDRRLVEALLSRSSLRLEVAPLFLEASPAQRAAILVAAQRAVLGRRSPRAPRLDAETASRLEYAAIAGDAREFAAALAGALGVDPALGSRISGDPTGEPLAVALIAIGAPRDLAVRIMTARDMQDGGGYPRVQTLARLSDRVSAAAARRVLAAFVGAPIAASAATTISATPRDAAHPSPFLRREGLRGVSPETTARSARDSRRP